eukprot:2684856-Rhodomonas_salina.1
MAYCSAMGPSRELGGVAAIGVACVFLPLARGSRVLLYRCGSIVTIVSENASAAICVRLSCGPTGRAMRR